MRPALLAAALLAGCAAPGVPDPRPLNILLLVADDMGHDHLGAAGHPVVKTPRLDALARDGVRFSRAFTSNPICSPSRAAILTGREPFANGCWFFGRPIRPGLPHFAQVLRAAGYETFYTGKWHNDGWPAARGFSAGGSVIGAGCPSSDGGHERPRARDLDGSGPRSVDRFCTTLTSDTAVDFLKRRAAGAPPFLMVVSYSSPHDPWTPPAADRYPPDVLPLPPNFMPRPPFRWFDERHGLELRDEALWPFPRTPEGCREVLSRYYGLVTQMDREIGRVLDALDTSGRSGDTLVAFVADHGISLGAHGFSGKQAMYEECLRLPMILRHPRLARAAAVNDALVSLVDLFPTFCEAAGVPAPEGLDGASLLGLYAGRGGWTRERVFAAFVSPVQHRLDSRAVRTRRHKYIENLTTGETELYDLERDPHERENLSGLAERAELQARLAAELRDWRRSAEPAK